MDEGLELENDMDFDHMKVHTELHALDEQKNKGKVAVKSQIKEKEKAKSSTKLETKEKAKIKADEAEKAKSL